MKTTYVPQNDIKKFREVLENELQNLLANKKPSFKKNFNFYRENHVVFDTPQDAGVETELRVGQLVRFVDYEGRISEPCEVLGFCTPTTGGCCVYIDNECYWLPVKPSSLIPEKNIIAIV